ncbi:hypothetical protein ACS0TY_011165 [Phlomoides rotata]
MDSFLKKPDHLSKGHLHLKNKNHNDNPSVTFNYFDDPQDLQRCVEGLKFIGSVIESKSFSAFRYDYVSLHLLLNITENAPVNFLPRHTNVTTSLEQFCKDIVMTICHYHGGCQLRRVVDSDYRLLGVDGSTFHAFPRANP